jgi:hypothetical protein
MTYPQNPRFQDRPTRRLLTPEQQLLAEALHARAESLRAGAEDGLSFREAVDLAAVQMGMAR